MMLRHSKKSYASAMNKLVALQSPVHVLDEEGGQTIGWEDVTTVWAAVDPIRATQRFEYQTVNVDATHRVTIRGNVTVNEKGRVRWGDRTFEILAVEDIREREIVKVLTCLEAR